MMVDFPAPVLPTRPIIWPASTSKLTFLMTGRPTSYSKLIFRAEMFPFISGIRTGFSFSRTEGSVSKISNIREAESIALAAGFAEFKKYWMQFRVMSA